MRNNPFSLGATHGILVFFRSSSKSCFCRQTPLQMGGFNTENADSWKFFSIGPKFAKMGCVFVNRC